MSLLNIECRYCAVCTAPLVWRHHHDSQQKYALRRFCSPACSTASRRLPVHIKKEAQRIRSARYYKKNKAMCDEQTLRRQALHPEKRRARVKRWRLAHPKRGRLDSHKRRTLKQSLPFIFTHADESFCRAYFQYACAVCGTEEGFQWTISMDHWIPLSARECPGTVITNMIPLCHGIGGCNNSKRHHPPEQWLLKRVGPRKATRILKKIHTYFTFVTMKEQAS